MGKTMKDHLESTFEDLTEDNLKKFKIKLRDREEEPRIRRAKIDKVEDALDLTDLMVNTFTLEGAVSVTVEILRKIDCNKQANELEELTKDGSTVSQPRVDVVDGRPGQGLKDEFLQSDDWQRELHVTPCTQQFKTKVLNEKGQEIYEVKDKNQRKRLALLINNRDFDDKCMTRRGAEKDEENMEWLLKELDYQVVKHKNLSGEQMKQAVKSFAQREEHAYSDSTFVVIMSHGKRDAILGVHYHKTNNPSDIFPVDDIFSNLNSENCPALHNKPKVILLQACRGGEHGRVWASDGEPDDSAEIEGDDFRHKEKDFICLMSCTPDTKSYRHVQKGTFFVQYIVDVFTKFAHEDHIEELFRKVLRRFESSDDTGNYRQMACKDRSSLTKLFYLFPGVMTSSPIVPQPGPRPPSDEQHFIDRNWTELVQRVHNVDAILDELLRKKVITDEDYSNVRAERTPQNQMRKLLIGPIKSAGIEGKNALYEALKETNRFLIQELEDQGN